MLYNVYNGTGSKTGHDMTFNDQNWGIFGRVGYPMAGICKQASEPPCMVYRSFLYLLCTLSFVFWSTYCGGDDS